MKKSSHQDYDVVVLGEINADLVVSGNTIPEFGQKEKIVSDTHLVMGSSAVIFACGCARLGLKTAFIGKVGDDLLGRFMLESMKERGIDTKGIVVDSDLRTGLSIILVEKEDRAILTYQGCIPELRYKDIEFSIIKKSRHLHVSSFYLLDKLRSDISEVLMEAKNNNLSVSLDTNYDPVEKWNGGLRKTLDFVDLFLPNETEAIAISKQKDIDQAIAVLAEIVDTLVVKRGAEGASVIAKNQKRIDQRAAAVTVVDTVGAGDSFDAGFVYGYLHNWPLERMLKFAVACGTLTTMKSGGTEGQASLEMALDFMENNLKERS